MTEKPNPTKLRVIEGGQSRRATQKSHTYPKSRLHPATIKLRVIEGAQSTYRYGDRVDCELAGHRFSGNVKSTFTKDGELIVVVQASMWVRAYEIKGIART